VGDCDAQDYVETCRTAMSSREEDIGKEHVNLSN
jgi:hypothetical protein